MFYNDRLADAATQALKALDPKSDTATELREALIEKDEPTMDELYARFGHNWAVCNATKRMRERYSLCIPPKRYARICREIVRARWDANSAAYMSTPIR